MRRTVIIAAGLVTALCDATARMPCATRECATPPAIGPAQARRMAASNPRVTFLPDGAGSGAGESFVARGPRTAATISAAEAVLTQIEPLWDEERVAAALRDPSLAQPENYPQRRSHHLRLRMLGANADAPAATTGRLGWTTNVYLGDDPTKWRAGVPSYTRTVYDDVWPGVDVAWHGERGGIEFDFVVAPGADPGVVAFHADDPTGETTPRLDTSGALIVGEGRYPMRLSAPLVWQETPAGRVEVPGRYVCDPPDALGRVHVGFAVGEYDRSLALVIDPGIDVEVELATPLGGTANDDVRGILRRPGDVDGFILLVNTPQVFQTTLPQVGNTDVLLLEYDSNGNLVHSAVAGGTGADTAFDAILDDDGNVYVCGNTFSANFPRTTGSYPGTGTSVIAGFLLCLDPGLVVRASARIEFGGTQTFVSVEVDDEGVYVLGTSTSSSLPATQGAWVASKPPGGFGAPPFLMCIDRDFGSPRTVTYLGPNESSGGGLAVLGDGNLGFAVATPHLAVPTVGGGAAGVGGYDIFSGTIDPAGTTMMGSAYTGGSGQDFVGGVASAWPGPGYYVSGTVGPGSSFNVPVPSGESFLGGNDGLVMYVNMSNPPDSQVTVVGVPSGSGNEILNGCSFRSPFLWVTGFGDSQDFPQVAVPPALTRGGGASDELVIVYDDPPGELPELAMSVSTGGTSHDIGICVDACDECAHVAAVTGASGSVPLVNPVQSPAAGGADDAWVTRMSAARGPCDPLALKPTGVAAEVYDQKDDGRRFVVLEYELSDDPTLLRVDIERRVKFVDGTTGITEFHIPAETAVGVGVVGFDDLMTPDEEEVSYAVTAVYPCGQGTTVVGVPAGDVKPAKPKLHEDKLRLGVSAKDPFDFDVSVNVEALAQAPEPTLLDSLLDLLPDFLLYAPPKRKPTTTFAFEGRFLIPAGSKYVEFPIDTTKLAGPVTLTLTLTVNGESKTAKLKLKPPKKPK